MLSYGLQEQPGVRGYAPPLLRDAGVCRATLRYPRFLLLSGEADLGHPGARAHGHFWASLAGPFVIVGIGTAFAFIPVSIAALAGVAEHEAGPASGLLNTFQQPGRPQLVSDQALAR